MTVRNVVFFLLIVCILMFSMSSDSYAQSSIEGQLTYLRSAIGLNELVTLIEGDRAIYTFSSPYCGAYSDDGERIAISSPEGAPLQIIDWHSGTTLFETPWQPDWKACDIVFTYDDHIVTILQEGSSYLVYTVDYRIQTITGPEISKGRRPPFQDLLELQSQFAFEFSPTWRYAFYGRCTNGEAVEIPSSFNEYLCAPRTDWVIYELSTRQQLYVVPNADATGLRSYPGPSVTLDGVAWSPDEHYLAYLRPFSYSIFIFPLTILNIHNGSLLDLPDFSTVEIDTNLGIHWSPDSRRVAVWAKDRPYTEPSGIEDERTLVIYDLDIEDFTIADPSYTGGGNLVWAPDSIHAAYRNGLGELVIVNTVTGSNTVHDTNVQRVLSWKPLAG